MFIAEESAPVQEAIQGLGIQNLTIHGDTPIAYVNSGDFQNEARGADLIYINARFAMTQLYAALFYSIAALKSASTVASTKHVLISTLSDLGESLGLKDLTGRLDQDTLFQIIFGPD